MKGEYDIIVEAGGEVVAVSADSLESHGGALEMTATISGAALFTVFTPWFALMMIWIFAFQLDWFPLGKFLDALLWRDAPVSANQIFNQMLLTVGAFGVFMLAAALLQNVLPAGGGGAGSRYPPSWRCWAAVWLGDLPALGIWRWTYSGTWCCPSQL